MDDLYQQLILDHYNDPQNRGEIKQADVKQEEANASCGDEFTFFIKWSEGKNKVGILKPNDFKALLDMRVQNDGRVIEAISFEGHGCAISTAACSLLTEELKGKSIKELPKLTLEYMQQLLGIEVTLARQKCAMLPVRAMQKALS